MADKITKKKNPIVATAIQASSDDGTKHVVKIGNLRVMISRAGNFWYAQGVDIDYAAQGKTVNEVKERFGAGLEATIREHLTIYGTIKNLLVVAPRYVWDQFYSSTSDGVRQRYTQVSVHDMLPFEEIEYLEMAPTGTNI